MTRILSELHDWGSTGDRDPSPHEHIVPVRWRGFQAGPGNRHPLWRGLCILQKRRQRLRERMTCLGLFNQSIADSNWKELTFSGYNYVISIPNMETKF